MGAWHSSPVDMCGHGTWVWHVTCPKIGKRLSGWEWFKRQVRSIGRGHWLWEEFNKFLHCCGFVLQLAGILKPYTGECLMEINPETGFLEYTKYAEYVRACVCVCLCMYVCVCVTSHSCHRL